MLAIPLGKIAVATPGTPVPITAAMITSAGGQLPPNGCVAKVEVCADPADSAKVEVKNAAGTIIKALPPVSSGFVACFCAHGPSGGNVIPPTQFSIDAATATQGPFVTVWID